MDSPEPLRIIVADPHDAYRSGLVRAASADDRLTVVAEAGDGTEALRLIAEHAPDAVILDLALPGAGGMEIAERLAEEARPGARVHVMTAAPGEALRVRARRAGAHVLAKEMDRDALLGRVLEEGGGGRGAAS